MEENDDILTTNEVAKLLKVRRQTISDWIRGGHLPDTTYKKIGRIYRFSRPAIMAWLESGSGGRMRAPRGESLEALGTAQMDLGDVGTPEDEGGSEGV